VIISQTPLRISFLGGGTDYPDYYRQSPRGGATLVTSIDKYTIITVQRVHQFANYWARVNYSKIEWCRASTRYSILQHGNACASWALPRAWKSIM
jgi:galactokinase/mevalonate kinase-like predicted kinase